MGAPLKLGWLEKLSVSAPSWCKNWRRRLLVLWGDGICWHRKDGPAGALRFEPGTTVQRDLIAGGSGSTLSIACAGRVLVLRGTQQEVRGPTAEHIVCLWCLTLSGASCRSMSGRRR